MTPSLTDDDAKLLRDLREFITHAQSAEVALVGGRLEDARDLIALISGQVIGLAMRIGIEFDEAFSLTT